MQKLGLVGFYGLCFALLLTVLTHHASVGAQKGKRIRPIQTAGEKQVFAIPSWGTAPSLSIIVPIGFELTQYKGPDFDVYYFNPKSESYRSFMGIYIGHNPSPDWPENARIESGMAGLAAITWHVWSEKVDAKVIYHREAIIEDFFEPRPHAEAKPHPPPLPYDHPPPPPPPPPPSLPPDPLEGLSIHIFVVGEDAKAVKETADWVVTLHKKD